jgi:hypothetical protein
MFSGLAPTADVTGRALTLPGRARTAIKHSHSITSSAVASRVGGMESPSALAVLRLMTNSNLVGCSTGRSAGFAPVKILCTNVAACRYETILRIHHPEIYDAELDDLRSLRQRLRVMRNRERTLAHEKRLVGRDRRCIRATLLRNNVYPQLFYLHEAVASNNRPYRVPAMQMPFRSSAGGGD